MFELHEEGPSHSCTHTVFRIYFFFTGRTHSGEILGEQFSLVLPLGLLESKRHDAREMPFLSIIIVCLALSRSRNKEAGRVKH